MVNRLWVLALCLPALIQAMQFTIGDYELAPRVKKQPDRKRIISRRMPDGDHEHVEEFVKGRQLEAREDEAEDPMDKFTVVFTEFETTSQLFKQCTTKDNTVNSIFLYYADSAKNFTAMRFTPKDGTTEPDFSSVDDASADAGTCITKAAEAGKAMAQHYQWWGWFWTTGYSCRASTTYYKLTDGQKCETTEVESVFLINKTS